MARSPSLKRRVHIQEPGSLRLLKEAWGRLPAYLFGWAELVMIRAAALGAISTTFAEYLIRHRKRSVARAVCDVHPLDCRWRDFLAGAVSYTGVKRQAAWST